MALQLAFKGPLNLSDLWDTKFLFCIPEIGQTCISCQRGWGSLLLQLPHEAMQRVFRTLAKTRFARPEEKKESVQQATASQICHHELTCVYAYFYKDNCFSPDLVLSCL